MSKIKVLLAMEKPFIPSVIKEMKTIIENAGAELLLLENYKNPNEIMDLIQDIDVLIIRSDKVTEEIINAATRLKLIIRAGSGTDNLDYIKELCEKRKIIIKNTPDANANAVAELFFFILGRFARNNFNGTVGYELKGKTLGVQGYGNVGKNIVRIARGFGMLVSVYDPKEKVTFGWINQVNSMEELYDSSRHVVLCFEKNASTERIVTYEYLQNISHPPVLINMARDLVIHEESLIKAMEEIPNFVYITDVKPECHQYLLENFPDSYFYTEIKQGAQTEEANRKAGLASAEHVLNFIKRKNRKKLVASKSSS